MRKEVLIFARVWGEGFFEVKVNRQDKTLCWTYYPHWQRGWGNNYGSCYHLKTIKPGENDETEYDEPYLVLMEAGWNSNYASRGYGMVEEFDEIVADEFESSIIFDDLGEMIENEDYDGLLELLKDILKYQAEQHSDYEEILEILTGGCEK